MFLRVVCVCSVRVSSVRVPVRVYVSVCGFECVRYTECINIVRFPFSFVLLFSCYFPFFFLIVKRLFEVYLKIVSGFLLRFPFRSDTLRFPSLDFSILKEGRSNTDARFFLLLTSLPPFFFDFLILFEESFQRVP